MLGDTCDRELPEVERLVADFGPQFKYVDVNTGRHTWGHEQINRGMELAQGAWLLAMDDDDVYIPGAFDAIRRTAAGLREPRPLLFRFVPVFRQLIWARPDPAEIAEDRIGGHNLVAPNIPERLGRWGPEYTGDFAFIRSTLDRWPGGNADAVWCADVLSVARPEQ